VPKFASFTAKKPAASSIKESESRPKERSESSRRSHHKHESRSSYSSRKHRHGDSRVEVEKSGKVSNAEPPSIPPTESSDIFVVDTRGDPSNAIYGSNNQWSVPKYLRRGAGRVVGADSTVIISKEGSTDRYVVLNDSTKRSDSSRTGLGQRRLNIPVAKRLVHVEHIDEEAELDEDFISLGKQKITPNRTDGNIMQEVRDLDKLDLHSENESDQTDDESASGDEDQKTTIRKNAELSRLTRSNPQNVDHWLRLIEHQEAMLTLGRSSENSRVGRKERVRLADIRISIYEEAIQKTKGQSKDQETLWIGLLDEVALVQDFDHLQRRWTDAVRNCPESTKIRLAKLDFIQTHYLQYGLEVCKKEFLVTMSFFRERFELSTTDSQRLELAHAHTYIFLRFTSFLRACGHHELAFALWQATLDIVLFSTPTNNFEEIIESFGEFWDSEAVRLGESPVGGWTGYLSSTEPQIPDPYQHVTEGINDSYSLELQQLVQRERALDEKLSLPGRTIDEYDDGDTYHMVMFSDLKDILSSLVMDQLIHTPIVTAFLCFFGIPNMPATPEQCLDWWSDSFIQTSHEHFWKTGDLSTENSTPFPASFRSRLNTVSSILEDTSCFGYVPKSQSRVVLEILRSLIAKFNHNDEIAVASIGYVLHHDGLAHAAKETKKLLKLQQTNISLYNAYFVIETLRGNYESAAKVISTPIKMTNSLPEKDQKSLVLLWRTWIWQYFIANDTQNTIHLLLSLDADHIIMPTVDHNALLQMNATSLLKSRQWINQGQQHSLRQGNASNFALFTDLGMLLAYFEHGQSLVAAMGYGQQSTSLITSSQLGLSRVRELIHQSRTSIIAFHSKYIRPYVPNHIKNLLQESMALFPHNTTFHEEYANQEISFGLSDRLRNILPLVAQDQEHDALPNWLFAIWFAYQRSLEIGGSPYVVRSTLDRAVESKRGGKSSTIWLLYLQFEQIHGDINSFRTVLSRALTRLPWVKEIIMEGLEYLDGKISNDEIGQLYSLLEEREIRMHQDHA
jgi:hypothetical protein